MYPKLLHIYGPFFIQSYGFCIALGLLIFGWLLFSDKKRAALVNDDQFHTLLMIGILCGVLGGRLLYFATNTSMAWYEFFEFWYGGFAVLGSILAVLFVMPIFFKRYQVPILPVLDRVALYTPLLQSISRIGCFLSGCCYGKQAIVSWAITYTNHECMAPLGVSLHPTQLYSALFLAAIFFFLLWIQRFLKNNGQLLACYLFFGGFERFIVDFFRDDRTYSLTPMSFYSDHQIISGALALFGGCLFLYCTVSKKTTAQVL